MHSRWMRAVAVLGILALSAAGCAGKGAPAGSAGPAGTSGDGSGKSALVGGNTQAGGPIASGTPAGGNPSAGGTAPAGNNQSSGSENAVGGAGASRSDGHISPVPFSKGPIPGVDPDGARAITVSVPERWRRGSFTTPRQLKVAPGFSVSVYATGLGPARLLALGPGSGDVYVSVTRDGKVLRLSDPGKVGYATAVSTVIGGLDRPHGLAWHDGSLYVAENGRVLRLHYKDGDAGAAAGYDVITRIASSSSGHFTRTILFAPDGSLLASAGSTCNVCREDNPRYAAIWHYSADGKDLGPYATGLRNAVGLTYRPGSQDLWATVNGRDALGDDLPPDQLNLARQGDDFGWPTCLGWEMPDPDLGRGTGCAGKTPTTYPLQAHSAPLGLQFYAGPGGAVAPAFPAGYQGSLFIALHGSWNRSVPTGYKVVRVRFDGAQPLAGYENFITGFRPWGRPVDLLELPDGSLLLSDDSSGTVYRITYTG